MPARAQLEARDPDRRSGLDLTWRTRRARGPADWRAPPHDGPDPFLRHLPHEFPSARRWTAFA
jgi:hypothetical protein